jgi:hypothetical protein
LKPEAQAEGIRVCCTKNPIPSARASGFLDFGFTQRNIKKRKLREITLLVQQPHSLGSRLGLPGNLFPSACHQSFRRRFPQPAPPGDRMSPISSTRRRRRRSV